jgi:O-antigen ligase
MDRNLSSAQGSAGAWVRDDRFSLFGAALIWALMLLMIVPESFDYTILSDPGGAPAAGSVLSRTLWAALLAASALVILARGTLASLVARRLNFFLVLFVALALASVVWSIDPALSARRLVRLVTIMLACCAFVLIGWQAQRYQQVMRPILALVLLASLVFGLAFPTLAIHQETAPELAGAWRGLANHKNGLGALACFGWILWLHGWLARELKLPTALIGLVTAAACLVLARSTTAVAAAAFVSAWLVLALRCPPRLRPYTSYVVILLLGGFCLYVLAALNLIPGVTAVVALIGALTDKDLSLTGRREIWAVIIEHIRYHPLFGTGYGAYWTPTATPGTDAYAFMWRPAKFYPGSAHNGYLDVMNDLGLAGLGCLIGYILLYARQAVRLLGVERNQAALYLALLFEQIITNIAESHWFSVLSVDFVVLTLASAAMARALLDARFRLAYGDPARFVAEAEKP